MHDQIGIYDEFILRAPAAPYPTSLTHPDQIIEVFKTNRHFRNALLLSSSSLFHQAVKLSEGKNVKGKEERIKQSLYKYYLRMGFRATPFGLWAGFCHGTFQKKTAISFGRMMTYQSFSRPDMNILIKVAREAEPEYKNEKSVKYFPNNTIYYIGDEIRYIAYEVIDNKRSYQIKATERSNEIISVLDYCKKGIPFNRLKKFISESLNFESGCDDFINDLISDQILKSNFEPVVSGPGFDKYLTTLFSTLPKTKESISLMHFLEAIQCFDKANPEEKESALKRALMQASKDFPAINPRFLIQTDMLLIPEKCCLHEGIKEKILESLQILIRLTTPVKNSTLEEFVKEYEKRYEGSEQPLLKVLDSECGIPYPQIQKTGDLTPLIDNLSLPEAGSNQIVIERTAQMQLIEQKVREAKQQGVPEINIQWTEVKDLPVEITLPDQFAAIIKVLAASENGIPEKILFEGAGGNGGINLFGRLAHTDEKIRQLAQRLAKEESLRYPDKIIAEIVHLPEERTGNILTRPFLRKFEIPYLAHSQKDRNKQIQASDLYIRIKKNRICLASKKLRKEIIPRLSTAHNYHRNTLPVYRFLCDLQANNHYTMPGFSWDYLEDIYDFLPAVRAGDVYFTSAQWIIRNESLSGLKKINKITDPQIRTKQFQIWQKREKLPQHIILCFHDNEIPLCLSEDTDRNILFTSAQNARKLTIKENKFNRKKPLFSINGQPYNNELNIIFQKHHAE